MTRHVLLVDDDDELRLAVNGQLGALGCDVVVVASGEDAMRIAEEQLRIDVLLTELRLPDIDGRELAWALGQKGPKQTSAATHHRSIFMCIHPSSGLLGQQRLDQALASLFSEVERAPRYERPLSLACLDIDHFKAVNDTYGHAAGDIVLRTGGGSHATFMERMRGVRSTAWREADWLRAPKDRLALRIER